MGGSIPFTVVVRCSDPRLEEFFNAGPSRDLMGLAPERTPLSEAHIANVGGLLYISGTGTPRLVDDVALLIALFAGDSGGRVVLTAHSACGGYNDAMRDDHADIRARQEDDMRAVASRLLDEIPDADVACYYLELETGEVVPFLSI